MKVTIIGLGLIGGSLAKAFKLKLPGTEVYAVDINADSLKQAQSIISKGSVCWEDYMDDSDIIFLCTSVSIIKQQIKNIAGKVKQGCVFTDVASTKQEIADITDAMPEDFIFVGGHPMAGSEKTGFDAAKAELFENVYYILTPSAKSTPEAVEYLSRCVRSLGAIDIILTPRGHDSVTAAVSHLPHVIASALVNMTEEIDDDGSVFKFAAGGFRDVTRIAASGPVMWRDISFSNKVKLVQMIDLYIGYLEKFKQLMIENRQDEVLQFFENGKIIRDALPQKAIGLLPKHYSCRVDISDTAGAIGKVAVLLGDNNINIKNITVTNNREFYGGTLLLSFSDEKILKSAEKLLLHAGYNVEI